MRSMLFYRDFRRFSGGHLKVWDYFRHVRAAAGWRAEVAFSAESIWDSTNPWFAMRDQVVDLADVTKPDAFFLGGMDWDALAPLLAAHPGAPVFNLIQHVVHADADNPRSSYLANRAIRICVSEDVRAALAATGKVNGPLYAIPNGIDFSALPPPAKVRDIDLLVEALKGRKLAELILPALRELDLNIHVITSRIPRQEYLELMSRARITLFLPKTREGFYLPALEGMALGTLVLCPDCVGNRSFCLPGVNSLQPDYKPRLLVQAVTQARDMAVAERDALLRGGQRTAAAHDIGQERKRFWELLSDCDELWRETGA